MVEKPTEYPTLWALELHYYGVIAGQAMTALVLTKQGAEPVQLYKWLGQPYLNDSQLDDMEATIARTLTWRLAIQGVIPVDNP